MPDPTYQQPDPERFPAGHMLRQLADLRAFEEAGQVRERMTDTFAVLKAISELAEEVRQLREALEPSSSPIVHGAEVLRAYRDLTEKS